MSSNTLTVKDFLGNSDYRLLSVPQYQRDYSWDDKQFEELWNDLEDIAIENSRDSEILVKNNHFLGLLVMISGQNGNADIVDGQQRLTTIFILLSALRDIFFHLRFVIKDEPTVSNRAKK